MLPTQVSDRLRKSVVLIKTLNTDIGSGTGSIVKFKDQPYLMTCNHVIHSKEVAENALVYFDREDDVNRPGIAVEGRQLFDLETVGGFRTDSASDANSIDVTLIAIRWDKMPHTDILLVRLFDYGMLEPKFILKAGDEVVIWFYSNSRSSGFSQSLSTGIVQGVSGHLFIYEAETAPGAGGAPVFKIVNGRAVIVGLHRGSVQSPPPDVSSPESLKVATHIHAIASFLAHTPHGLGVVGITTVYRRLLEVAQDFPELQVSVSRSVLASLITGASTAAAVASSVLLGPAGVLAGAAVGGAVAYASGGSYRPALQVLTSMTDAEKEKLRDGVLRAARARGILLLTAAAWEHLPLVDRKEYLREGLKFSGYLLPPDDSSPPPPSLPTWTEQYKKAIEQRGSVTLHITRCVLIGPPRVGKSSLKLLLINNEPPGKEVEKSTDLMEAPVVLTSLQCQDKKGSQWKELTTNSLQQLVIKSTREAWYDPGKSSPIQSSHASQLTSEGSTSHISTAVASDTDVSRTTVADSLNTSTHLVDSELEVRYHDFVDTKLSGESLAELKLNGLKMVHVFDCGGQLAFQDTIPLLINAPCAFISVFNASIDLDEEVELKYCPKKGEELGLGHKESQWSMLRRIFSSIHSLQFKCHGDILCLIKDTKVVPSSPIAVVGTHKDVLREASKKDGGLRQRRTEEKVKKYLDQLRDSKLYDFLREGCTHDLVTNQFKDDLSAIESLRKDITESKATLSLELPLSWIILELFTRSCPLERKFIPFHDLQQLCIRNSIVRDKEEFSSLLKVLHVLGFYAFYQLDGVPEDQNWVCTDAATLYREVTNMLVVQYKKNIKKGATFELQRYGRIRLNMATLQDVFTDLEINIDGADPMWLIRVLLHIGLAAKIEDEGQEAAFIPLTLPFKRSDLPPVTSVATLCFTLEFPSGASKDRVHDNVIEIPRGIFPRLIVYLLSPQCLKEFKWQVDKGDSRSRIKLTHPSYEYTIYLSEHIDHIELDLVLNDTFVPTLENVDMCTTKAVGSLCQGLRKHLVSALGDTFVSVFGKQRPERRPSVVCGLKCSACPDSSHMAIVRPAEKSTPQHPLHTWKCVHEPRLQSVKKPDQLIWFSPEKETTFKRVKTHDQGGQQWMIWVMKGTDASKLVTQDEAEHTLTSEEFDQLKQFKVMVGSLVWVMLGVTGAGKSCVGNFILGQDKSFPESKIMVKSETEKAALKCSSFDNENLCVIDTPGLGDTAVVGSFKSDAEGVAYDYSKLATELTKVMMMMDQGINAFLIVVPAHHREYHSLKALLDFFDIIGAYWNHSIMVVTHGKEYGNTEEEQYATYREEVLTHPEGPALLKKLLDKVSGRLVIVESKDWRNQPEYHRSVVGKIMKYSKEITDQHGPFKDDSQSIGKAAHEKAKLELHNEFEDMKSPEAQAAVFQRTFKHVRDVVHRLVRIKMADGEDVDKMKEMAIVKEEELNEVREQRDFLGKKHQEEQLKRMEAEEKQRQEEEKRRQTEGQQRQEEVSSARYSPDSSAEKPWKALLSQSVDKFEPGTFLEVNLDIISCKFSIGPSGKALIYVRESFEGLWKCIGGQADKLPASMTTATPLPTTGPGNKFLITGTPGTGKSCFAYYLLPHLLAKEGDSVLYQNCHKDMIFFVVIRHSRDSEFEVEHYHMPNNSLPKPKLGFLGKGEDSVEKRVSWYIFDSGHNSGAKPQSTDVPTIVISSLDCDQYKDFMQMCPEKFYMPTWERPEIEAVVRQLHPDKSEVMDKKIRRAEDDCTQKKISIKERTGIIDEAFPELARAYEAFFKHGGVIREVLNPQSEGRLEALHKAIDRSDGKGVLLDLLARGDVSSAVSHRVLHQVCDKKLENERVDYQNPSISFASDHVFNRFWDKHLQKKADITLDQLSRMYEFVSPDKENNRLTEFGYKFEELVHRTLESGNHYGKPLKFGKNPKSKPIKLTFDSKVERKSSYEKTESFIVCTIATKDADSTAYVFPSSKTFPAIDAFLPDQKYLIQVTIAENHPVAVPELLAFIASRGWHPKETTLVFVVLDKIYTSFQYQQPRNPDTLSSAQIRTFNEIKQFALPMPTCTETVR